MLLPGANFAPEGYKFAPKVRTKIANVWGKATFVALQARKFAKVCPAGPNFQDFQANFAAFRSKNDYDH